MTADGKFSTLPSIAEVVELVDTLASGASGGNPVEVRVLFSVPLSKFKIFQQTLAIPWPKRILSPLCKDFSHCARSPSANNRITVDPNLK